ncbi:DUF4136 domain-containing protein [Pseudoteredinibacter isoporae]|uniref:DUF4136 domain-containing protein n=1 Tax=Pseudoteredinibacter isoporae TaxID=570281 RepID=A0A7X0JP85_9GAMM|nr:DUF4136 domain-containing protein [Pseudoteredinibacter isoporae]MBB6519763.1 hypothetical protein [Pseudoteredinibacter isoporae]NHO85344.1 DUF4136 domain-containing protein [Pseudoteredinibacter isoporae]NIB26204.1 DUF4136 domain-containing protein [Pseudoteredinibacter isoporae]
MKYLKILLLSALTITLAACNKSNIKADYDTDTNFSKFERFYLVPSRQSTLRDTQITDMELGRVERAIASQVKTRYSEVFNPLEADIIVSYYLDSGKRDGVSLSGNYSGNANSGSWRAKAKEADSLEPELIIDINSNSSGKMLWRGSVTLGEESKAKPEERQKRYETAIAKLLASLPK